MGTVVAFIKGCFPVVSKDILFLPTGSFLPFHRIFSLPSPSTPPCPAPVAKDKIHFTSAPATSVWQLLLHTACSPLLTAPLEAAIF